MAGGRTFIVGPLVRLTLDTSLFSFRYTMAWSCAVCSSQRSMMWFLQMAQLSTTMSASSAEMPHLADATRSVKGVARIDGSRR